jgi:type II secretory pathway pseudopilin PulG
LIELLIVITVFSVCAAICVRIFTESHLTAARTRDASHALTLARNAAEQFKAQGLDGDAVYYYCANWEPRNGGDGDVSFVMRMTRIENESLPSCVITVSRASGDDLITLTAASREGANDG